jgi:hypothetical protein
VPEVSRFLRPGIPRHVNLGILLDGGTKRLRFVVTTEDQKRRYFLFSANVLVGNPLIDLWQPDL